MLLVYQIKASNAMIVCKNSEISGKRDHYHIESGNKMAKFFIRINKVSPIRNYLIYRVARANSIEVSITGKQ